MSEAFEKWFEETQGGMLAGVPEWVRKELTKAAWKACEKQMRSSTRDLYYKCPGCGEYLAIPIKPHYCNVGLHVSSAPTRADILALAESEEGRQKLRGAVAVEVCGAKDDQDGYGWRFPRFPSRTYPTAPHGLWIKQSNFKPDVDPAHNWMVVEAMQGKGFVCSFGYTTATNMSWARFWDETDESLGAYPADLIGKQRVKEAVMLAALFAVRVL